MPYPFTPFLEAHPHLLAPLICGFVARYIPLPLTSASPRPASHLTTSRELLMFITFVIALQLFAFPPSPNKLDMLVLVPLSVVTFLARPVSSSSTKVPEPVRLNYANRTV